MKKFTTLLLAILMVLPAMADKIPAGTKLYFKPDQKWYDGSARFEAYFWNESTNGWKTFTQVQNTGIHFVTSPDFEATNIIICRMDPNKAVGNWDSKWTQTGDLVYNGSDNCFYITEKNDGYSTNGTWGTVDVKINGISGNWDGIALSNYENEKFTDIIKISSADEFKITVGGAWLGNGSTISNATETTLSENNNNMKWGGTAGYVKVEVELASSTKLTCTYMKPEIISFEASENEVFVRETVNFTSEKKYSDDEVEFYVNDTKVTAEWTPESAGIYTVEARLAGADTKTVTITVSNYPENITSNKCYAIAVGNAWDEPEGCWYAAKFINKNTNKYTWSAVPTHDEENNGYVFYLAPGNTPLGHEPQLDPDYKYTHVEFVQIPETVEEPADIRYLDLADVEGCKTTGEIYYDGELSTTYDLANKTRKDEATGVNRVEMAGGIGYAYGVVSAEGAIEVYNVNGAVVARGNDTIDLRGLGRGIYIIRNGNQVRKVVR